MRIVILDSCRDNPFGDAIDLTQAAQPTGPSSGTRGGGGLALPSPDRGTLVSFAAKDGNIALDGEGQNSPFALALAEKLRQPNLEISLMFRPRFGSEEHFQPSGTSYIWIAFRHSILSDR